MAMYIVLPPFHFIPTAILWSVLGWEWLAHIHKLRWLSRALGLSASGPILTLQPLHHIACYVIEFHVLGLAPAESVMLTRVFRSALRGWGLQAIIFNMDNRSVITPPTKHQCFYLWNARGHVSCTPRILQTLVSVLSAICKYTTSTCGNCSYRQWCMVSLKMWALRPLFIEYVAILCRDHSKVLLLCFSTALQAVPDHLIYWVAKFSWALERNA